MGAYKWVNLDFIHRKFRDTVCSLSRHKHFSRHEIQVCTNVAVTAQRIDTRQIKISACFADTFTYVARERRSKNEIHSNVFACLPARQTQASRGKQRHQTPTSAMIIRKRNIIHSLKISALASRTLVVRWPYL